MGRYAKAAAKARQLTNKELATEVAALAPINRDKLNELLPSKQEKEAFLQLMAQVEDETSVDNQLSYLRSNLETAGKAALRVLRLLV